MTYYKIKNKIIERSKNKDYMYDREHRKIKLYPLDYLDINEIEEIINTNYSYDLVDIDFLDEDIVKCIIKLDVNDLKYEYDLETIIAIKDFLNTIYVSNLSDTQLRIFEMYNKGKTQQYIADILGCSRQVVTKHLDKIVKKKFTNKRCKMQTVSSIKNKKMMQRSFDMPEPLDVRLF